MVKNGTEQELLQIYKKVAAKANRVGIADDVVISVSPELLGAFPTIQDAGYSPRKLAQVYRNYWNSELVPALVADLRKGKVAEMSLNHKAKNNPGQTGKFCMKHFSGAIVDNELHITVFYRTADMYRAWLADLVLFNIEFNKIANELGVKLATVFMALDTAQVRNWTYIVTIQRDFGCGYEFPESGGNPKHRNVKFGLKVLENIKEVNPGLFASTRNLVHTHGFADGVVSKMKKHIRLGWVVNSLSPEDKNKLLVALS